MSVVVPFPPARAANPPIARMACEACGGAPMIFLPGPVRVLAFCGGQCAAWSGVRPWAEADAALRARWMTRAEMEAQPA